MLDRVLAESPSLDGGALLVGLVLLALFLAAGAARATRQPGDLGGDEGEGQGVGDVDSERVGRRIGQQAVQGLR